MAAAASDRTRIRGLSEPLETHDFSALICAMAALRHLHGWGKLRHCCRAAPLAPGSPDRVPAFVSPEVTKLAAVSF